MQTVNAVELPNLVTAMAMVDRATFVLFPYFHRMVCSIERDAAWTKDRP